LSAPPFTVSKHLPARHAVLAPALRRGQERAGARLAAPLHFWCVAAPSSSSARASLASVRLKPQSLTRVSMCHSSVRPTIAVAGVRSVPTVNWFAAEETPLAMELLNRNARRPKKVRQKQYQGTGTWDSSALYCDAAGQPRQAPVLAPPPPPETARRQEGIDVQSMCRGIDSTLHSTLDERRPTSSLIVCAGLIHVHSALAARPRRSSHVDRHLHLWLSLSYATLDTVGSTTLAPSGRSC
jgi:hypothetical protein